MLYSVFFNMFSIKLKHLVICPNPCDDMYSAMYTLPPPKNLLRLSDVSSKHFMSPTKYPPITSDTSVAQIHHSL